MLSSRFAAHRPPLAMLVVGLLVVGLLVVACAGASPLPSPAATPSATTPVAPTATATASPSASPGATTGGLLLEVRTEGGFISPVATLSALPTVVVEADGHIYTPGAPRDGGSLVPPVDVRDVGAAGATAIVDAMRAAGLGREHAASGVAMPDAGVTVFTAVIDGTTVVNRFAAGGTGGGPGRPGGGIGGSSPAPAGSPDPASAAFDLLARLADPTVAWGGAAPVARPYVPAAYRIYAAPAPEPGTGPAPAWPFAAGLSSFGRPAVPDFGIAGLRTGVVTGTDAATLRPVLESVSPGATFVGGGSWTLWVTPLLPGEPSG
jgi:hypothetical protein